MAIHKWNDLKTREMSKERIDRLNKEVQDEIRRIKILEDPPASCGNSCIIAKKVGMGTNGGCHCLDGLSIEQRQNIKKALLWYRAKIEDLEYALTLE